jgi:DNA-binding transcriptional ArsR family regulator
MKCNAYHVFFQNLANPLKTQIVQELKKKPMSVSELMKEINTEQSKLSHALMNLRKCHIVNAKQIGKQRIYSLNKKTIVPILKIIDKHKTNFCPGCKLK